jgi:hypothetical protein
MVTTVAGMAIVHRAELTPSKAELLAQWLPTQDWYGGGPGPALTLAGAFRFDDPAGEVGIETILAVDDAGDGTVMHVPMTYRGSPMAAGTLIGELHHSVLGPRWVYDATSDPVYVTELARVIATGDRQVDIYRDGELVVAPNAAGASGSGAPDNAVPDVGEFTVSTSDAVTTITSDAVIIEVLRRPEGAVVESGGLTLTATWAGGARQAVLATLRPNR